MQHAIEKLCGTKMNSISVVYEEGTIVEIFGIFSFVLDNVSKIDAIIKMKKMENEVKLDFTS